MHDSLSSEGLEVRNKIIRISKGPQFGVQGGHFIALIALTFFIGTVYSITVLEFIPAAVLMLTGSLLLSIALDFRGIEINRRDVTIREYKAIFWWRTGKFKNIRDFNAIYLLPENVIVSSEFTESANHTYHYYRIYMVDEIGKNSIFVAEFKNFYKAEIVAKRITDLTGMRYKCSVKTVKRVTRDIYRGSQPTSL